MHAKGQLKSEISTPTDKMMTRGRTRVYTSNISTYACFEVLHSR